MGNKKDRRRVDVTGDDVQQVPDDRMAALAALLDDGGAVAAAPPPSKLAAPRRPWTVDRTRKGTHHVSIERRPGNKVVTIVHGVHGDGAVLVRELKRHCGAGGTVRDDTVEVQGDHRDAIMVFLAERAD